MNRTSYLVQILLPKENGRGQPVPQEWFAGFLRDMVDKFGGATSFVRAPAEGMWRGSDKVEQDNIAVIEVMTEGLDRQYWQAIRRKLELELAQEKIVIRAQNICEL